MKLRTKDEIITCLIDILEPRYHASTPDCFIHDGWIEALKWVLRINNEEVSTEGKNTLVVEQKNVDSKS